MPLYITRGDITQMEVDAIVNPTDYYFSGSGGTDEAIHLAAGPGLRAELLRFPPIFPGEAVITSAHRLQAKYIIHTHGPIWIDGTHNEAELLSSCYRNCLQLALEHDCKTIAFPLISGGTFGFPNDDALTIAKNVINDFLSEHSITAHIIAYKMRTFNLGAKLFADISRFVSENYIELDTPDIRYSVDDIPYDSLPSLEEMLRSRGETFSCMLDRLRDERRMTGPELYKKAWVHKSVYSKIMHNINYQPAKITTVAFALALELPWNDFTELVSSAGYAMTHTSKFDIVVEFFVKRGDYDIEHINAVLFELDPELPLIGF